MDKKAALDAKEREARQDAAQGERAERLLNDDLLVGAFAAVEAELTQIWRNSQIGEGDKRDDAWRSLRLLKGIQAAIGQHVRKGQFAHATLAQIEQERRLYDPQEMRKPPTR